MKVVTGSNELFVSQISQIDLAFIWQFNFPSKLFQQFYHTADWEKLCQVAFADF